LGYLVEYFYDLGQSQSTGNGFAPVSWQEVKAWRDLRGIYFEYWELKLLRDMSCAYVVMYAQAQNPKCNIPKAAAESILAKRKK